MRHCRITAVLLLALTAVSAAGEADVDALVRQLDAGDDDARAKAVAALGKLGPNAKAAVPALTKVLSEPDEGGYSHVKGLSIIALGKIGPAASPAARELARLLGVSYYRAEAGQALEKIGAGAVPALTARLADENAAVRSAAAYALAQVGPKAAPAVPSLIRLLKDKFRDARRHAADALGSIGPDAKPAVPALIDALDDRENPWGVAAALTRIGPAARPAIPKLRQLLRDPDPNRRSTAAGALGQLGKSDTPVVDDLIRAAVDPDCNVRFSALSALGRIGPVSSRYLCPGPCAPSALYPFHGSVSLDMRTMSGMAMRPPPPPRMPDGYVRATEDKDWHVRVIAMALMSVGQWSPWSWRVALPRLVKSLADERPLVRAAAARALFAAGHAGHKTASTLLRLATKDEDAFVRAAAIAAACNVGTPERKLAPALIAAIKDRDSGVRLAALKGARSRGVAVKGALGAIIGALRDKDWRVRYQAVLALQRLGYGAKDAIPHLIERLGDENDNVSGAACGVFARIGIVALDPLIRALKGGAPATRRGAALAFIYFGPNAKPAVPALIDALSSEDDRLVDRAARALRAIGPGTKDAVPALVRAMQCGAAQTTAGLALRKIGAAKKTDVPALIKLIGHKNPRVAATAAEVLGRTGPHIAGAAVPELIAALDAKRHQWVRHQAAIALGKMGNAAKPAVPALTAALKDPDHALRVHAERSLERITGRPQEK